MHNTRLFILLREVTLTPPLSQTPPDSVLLTDSLTQEVVVCLSFTAQVSENRSKLRDAVMHDDIIKEKGRLLRS